MQIVQSLEPLAVRPVEEHFGLADRRVDHHQPARMVGDEDAAVAVDLEPVGLAVIGRDHGEVAAGRYLEDLPIGDVGDIEVAVAVKRRPFDKAVARHPRLVARVLVRAQLVGDTGEDLGLDDGRRGEQGAAPR